MPYNKMLLDVSGSREATLENSAQLHMRAYEWFHGELPPDDTLGSYTTTVLDTSGVTGQVIEVTYEIFALLYPARGLYEAVRVDRPRNLGIDAIRVREIIAGFTPSVDQVRWQRDVARAYGRQTARERWSDACMHADLRRLPVAMMAFGLSQHGRLIVTQCTVAIAPLRRVAEEFKRAAPRIMFN